MSLRYFACWIVCGVSAAAILGGCDGAKQAATSPEARAIAAGTASIDPVAVSSPYLEAAIRDVLLTDVPLIRLAGPAMCPGHFDMRPSQISDLARCRFLVRFDFQQALDEKLGQRGGNSPSSLAIQVPGGMCEPESYTSVCRQIADHFVSLGELKAAEADDRLAQVAGRMASLSHQVTERIDAMGLRGTPVLASRHQAAFCGWLGLRVVATFSGSDTAGTREIDRAVTGGETANVGLIIANEPEGRRLADALADRLHAKVAVFANFPAPGQDNAFDALVLRNIAALSAVPPSPGEHP